MVPTDAEGTTDHEPGGRLTTNIPRGSDPQPVNTIVRVKATDARLSSVSLSSAAGRVDGVMAKRGARWVASERLEPGQSYTLGGVAEGADGAPVRLTSRFGTEPLTLDQQTYASVAPLSGETVGVGMPVIVTFDIPVMDRAEFERHMTVTSTPGSGGRGIGSAPTRRAGAPRSTGSRARRSPSTSTSTAYPRETASTAQEDRSVNFEVGDAHMYEVNAHAHQMKVFSNGELLRTLPVTLGKAGFTTRSGIKLIMAQYASKRMNSETVGIPAGSSEAYDLDNVQWAMRLTNSGEFIHAAPWPTGSQGHANVSHGCTRMSTADAAWLYAMSRRGDVVVYTGTGRPMTVDNGYGDWNASFHSYRRGSALSRRSTRRSVWERIDDGPTPRWSSPNRSSPGCHPPRA